MIDNSIKDYIKNSINNYVKNYSREKSTKTTWDEPIIAYGDAKDPLFLELKNIVDPNHAIPQDFLSEAKTVITYFLPFDKSIVESNVQGTGASKIWAVAYIETNKLIGDLNVFIHNELKELGYKAAVIPTNYEYSEEKLICHWSQRHIGNIAGLGKFGINNMLITDKGCSGRVGSIVTNLEIEPTQKKQREYCLYKENGSCKKCVSNCKNGALKVDSFDRYKCYEMCLYNVETYSELGFCDVCGKCTVDVPCSFVNPVKNP